MPTFCRVLLDVSKVNHNMLIVVPLKEEYLKQLCFEQVELGSIESSISIRYKVLKTGNYTIQTFTVWV